MKSIFPSIDFVPFRHYLTKFYNSQGPAVNIVYLFLGLGLFRQVILYGSYTAGFFSLHSNHFFSEILKSLRAFTIENVKIKSSFLPCD